MVVPPFQLPHSSFQRELESLQGVLRELLESQVMEEFAKVAFTLQFVSRFKIREGISI